MSRLIASSLIVITAIVSLAVGGLISAPAVKDYIEQGRISACWSAGMKRSSAQLIRSEALSEFVNTLPRDFTRKDRQKIKSTFKAPVSGFYTDQESKNQTKIKCGAGLGYSYTRPDGSISKHDPDRIVYFYIYPAHGGYTPVMSSSQIPNRYIAYRENVVIRHIGLRFVAERNKVVVISSVKSGSLAAQAGIEAGDVLLGVGHFDVTGRANAERLIEKARTEGKSAVALRVKRDANVLFIPVPFNQ